MYVESTSICVKILFRYLFSNNCLVIKRLCKIQFNFIEHARTHILKHAFYQYLLISYVLNVGESYFGKTQFTPSAPKVWF